jgi:hypothetical protein
VLLEEEEVEVVFSATRDKATITTLLGTCANPTHPLPTLGGGCVVECEHLEDLCMLTPLNSHAFIAPANFKSIDNYYPVMCRWVGGCTREYGDSWLYRVLLSVLAVLLLCSSCARAVLLCNTP